MYAMRDFMMEANDNVNYTSQERDRNEWIVRRKDDKGLFEAFRIVRRDEMLELGYECDSHTDSECGRSEQREIMCRRQQTHHFSYQT